MEIKLFPFLGSKSGPLVELRRVQELDTLGSCFSIVLQCLDGIIVTVQGHSRGPLVDKGR